MWVLFGYFCQSDTYFKWRVLIMCGSNKKHHKDTHLKKIGLCFLIFVNYSTLIINTIGGGGATSNIYGMNTHTLLVTITK